MTEAGERAAKARAERATAGELARDAVNVEAMERTAAREEVEVEAIMIRPRPKVDRRGEVRVEVNWRSGMNVMLGERVKKPKKKNQEAGEQKEKK